MIIGIDIGGTKITGIVFDGQKEIKARTVKTPKNLESFKHAVLELVDFLSEDKKISGVGVGMAGIMDPKERVAKYSPNLKFVKNLNFKKLMGKRAKRVEIDNDANCFVLAENNLGQCRKFKDFVGLTLGTGIGGGVIINNIIYRGFHFSAGEAGHMTAGEGLTYEQVFQKVRDKKDFKRMAQVIGKLLADVYNLLDVEVIVLGGSVATKEYKHFLTPAKKIAEKHILNKSITPKVLISKLKNSGALGAALLLK